jgi:phosphatidylglycerol:prolipoprotein diacylglycerol transferase
VPIGLFFGRIANFINSELWGRVTDVPWGVIFPNGGPEPRHPSQLYEACLEGLVLFVIVNWLERSTTIREKPGALSGVLLIGYGIARIIAEFFRVPDEFLGYLAFDIVTMGQILSLPLIIAGLALLFRPAHRTTA